MGRGRNDPVGEPLLTCFDCERGLTLGQLTLFPWWDVHAEAFDAMYRCERCLPKAHKALARTLRQNATMLARFAEFVDTRVTYRSHNAATESTADAPLAAALRALDALRTHEATIAR